MPPICDGHAFLKTQPRHVTCTSHCRTERKTLMCNIRRLYSDRLHRTGVFIGNPTQASNAFAAMAPVAKQASTGVYSMQAYAICRLCRASLTAGSTSLPQPYPAFRQHSQSQTLWHPVSTASNPAKMVVRSCHKCISAERDSPAHAAITLGACKKRRRAAFLPEQLSSCFPTPVLHCVQHAPQTQHPAANPQTTPQTPPSNSSISG
jgi:hypothetical protein